MLGPNVKQGNIIKYVCEIDLSSGLGYTLIK